MREVREEPGQKATAERVMKAVADWNKRRTVWTCSACGWEEHGSISVMGDEINEIHNLFKAHDCSAFPKES